MQLKHISLFAVLQQFTGHVCAQIDLGTAASFGVVASSSITNTGATIITGSLGLSPNADTSITGFPPGLSGEVYAGDAVADQARQDARTAYNTASSLASTSPIAGADLGGQTLVAGVYTSTSAVGLTGTLTLDGQNDANSLFVFQIGSTLTTASSASVVLINGARACNVFFQIGSSATLGTLTTFRGNILALASISLSDGVSVTGGLYALNGAVTLINDRIVAQQECVTIVTSTTGVVSSTAGQQPTATEPTTSQTSILGASSTFFADTTTLPLFPTTVAPVPSTTTSVMPPDQPDQPDQPDIPNTPDIPNIPDIPSIPDVPDIPDIPDIPDKPITRSIPRTTRSRTSTTITRSTTPRTTNVASITTSSGLIIVKSSSKQVISSTTSRALTTVSLSTLLETTTTMLVKSSTTTTLSKKSYMTRSTLPKATSTAIESSGYLTYVTLSSRRSRSSRTVQSTHLISSSTPTVTSESEYYRIYKFPSTSNSTPYARSSSGTQSYQAYTNVTSSAFSHPTYPAARTTEINGTPCTTLTYYEPTCACTQTTIVPVAYTPGPTATGSVFTPATVTTVSGVACTTASYYEQACDCVLNTHVPLEVLTETASIHTVISNIPYVTLKRYEVGCGCVKTATVPVRIASATPVVNPETECVKSRDALFTCVAACLSTPTPA